MPNQNAGTHPLNLIIEFLNLIVLLIDVVEKSKVGVLHHDEAPDKEIEVLLSCHLLDLVEGLFVGLH